MKDLLFRIAKIRKSRHHRKIKEEISFSPAASSERRKDSILRACRLPAAFTECATSHTETKERKSTDKRMESLEKNILNPAATPSTGISNKIHGREYYSAISQPPLLPIASGN